MRKSENIRELEYLASSQWGMFTSAQARALGVSGTQLSRLVTAGAVELMRRGTYRYVVGEETSHAYIKAAWLAAYPKSTAAERLRARPLDAVVAGRTASALHGIGDLHEDPYTFIVRVRRQTSFADLEFHTWPLDDRDVTFVEGLPVTTMERTIVDLVKGRQDPEHIRRAVVDALVSGASVMRLDALIDELGSSGGPVTESVRALVCDARKEDPELVIAEAMRSLGEVLLDTTRVMGLQKDEAGLRKVAERLDHFENERIDATRPVVESVKRNLILSMRALLEEIHESSGQHGEGVKSDG